MKHPHATLPALPLALALLALPFALALLIGQADHAQAPSPSELSAAPALGGNLVTVYSRSGHTSLLAEDAASKTGADVYLIGHGAPYPANESVVLVGSPVWFGDAPGPVKGFLQPVDFGGK
ncbi:MAG: hypothetical protein LBW85_01775 [Deltaproteobacteria bacterium]|jgi:hypothetical protein|nr:hypothetical protein [Deltaproteobacteria bacterium]